MDGRRPEMRRTMTLSEQLSTPDKAIRDFLKIPHDADDGGSLHEGDSPAAGGSGWKPLRDRLSLRRAAAAWQMTKPGTAAAPVPTNSGDLSSSRSSNNRSSKYNYSTGEATAAFSRTFSSAPSLRATPTFSRVASTRVGPTSSRSSSRRPAMYDFRDHEEERHNNDDPEEDGDDDDEDEDDDEEGKDEAPAAQMSLMALLEQTDSQWDDEDDEEGSGGGGARKNGGHEGDDDEEDGEGREEEMVHVCCVCMVRHKGAAFIPCGHTFCRLCSRELWVSRGNCPLCNGFIQEILDIF